MMKKCLPVLLLCALLCSACASSPEKEIAPPEITLQSEDLSLTAESGETILRSSVERILCEPGEKGEYAVLSKALEEYNEHHLALIREQNETILHAGVLQAYENGELQLPEDAYVFALQEQVLRADSKVVGLETKLRSGCGDEEPQLSGKCFDSRTGELLTLEDVLSEKGEERFPALFESLILAAVPDYVPSGPCGATDDIQAYAAYILHDDPTYLSFTLGEDGLILYAENRYDAVRRTVVLNVPYDEDRELFEQ